MNNMLRCRLTKQATFGVVLAITLLWMPALKAATNGGQDIFKSQCALCHGADGSGDTQIGKTLQAADLGSADVQKLSIADLTKIVHDGKNKMPSFKDKLTAQQIKDVIGYVRTLARKGK